MVLIKLAKQCGSALIRHAGIRAPTFAGIAIAEAQPIGWHVQPSRQRAQLYQKNSSTSTFLPVSVGCGCDSR